RGQPCQRQRRGIDMAECRWLLANDRGTERELLAIGAVASGLEHTEYVVADLQVGDIGAERTHCAREVTAQDQREVRLLVLASAHLPVGGVDAGGRDIDHDLTRPRLWIGQVAHLKDLGSTELLNKSSFHDSNLSVDPGDDKDVDPRTMSKSSATSTPVSGFSPRTCLQASLIAYTVAPSSELNSRRCSDG